MSLFMQQQAFTSHMRDPDSVAAPEGVEQRRLTIYSDLLFNNLDTFISSGFPILKQLFDTDDWQAMIRDFMRCHRCQSPYFMEISQEFLLYLQHHRQAQPHDPPFLLELAHYEWVELALDISEEDIEAIPHQVEGDLLTGMPLVSPLAWSLAYQWPVHQIGEDFQPQAPGEQATYLIVYRNRADKVAFMETNAVTARLLEILQGARVHNGRSALLQLAEEMQHPQPEQLLDFGHQLLQQLRDQDIILGILPEA